MKAKNYIKNLITLACVLLMLVSLAPLSISALQVHDVIIMELFQPYEKAPDRFERVEAGSYNHMNGLTLDTSDYAPFIQPCANESHSSEIRDLTLELAGFKRLREDDFDNFPSEEEFQQALKEASNPLIGNQDSISIPAYPVNGTEEAQNDWLDEYGDNIILVSYILHRPNLQGSQMYFDDNYHWQLCTECGNRAYLANHTDKDADGKCDLCGNAIRYYNVSVKNVTGGKVTLSATKGAMNDKITVTVTPDAGYHVEALNFVNANAAQSKRAVWEDAPNAEYHFFIANWDVEVEAVFIKD